MDIMHLFISNNALLYHQYDQEVNVPKHTTRYSNLVSVNVSEESVQEMTVRPRKNEYLEPRRTSSQEEPNIMDLYPRVTLSLLLLGRGNKLHQISAHELQHNRCIVINVLAETTNLPKLPLLCASKSSMMGTWCHSLINNQVRLQAGLVSSIRMCDIGSELVVGHMGAKLVTHVRTFW